MVRYSLCLFLFGWSVSPLFADTMLGAADILDALPETIPLADARGIAIVPGTRDAKPEGVLLARPEGQWGDPVFVTLHPSAQHVAGNSDDRVLIFRTRRSLERVVNGDGLIDSDVTVYARVGGSFVPAKLEGATLRKHGVFSFGPGRKPAAAMKAKMIELTAPKTVAELRSQVSMGWELFAEYREAIFGGLATVGAWLVTGRSRKR